MPTWLIVVLVVVAVAGLVLLAAQLMPERPASNTKTAGHSDVDSETDAYREHPPGGGTGSL